MAREVFWTMSKDSFRQCWLPKISEFEIVFAYICYYSRSMKPILYINKNVYLRVCYILKNVLTKMGFSPFSLSDQAGKKGG
jgi:hypothetical protein